uniref:Si:dkey-96g2.1 n=1 Tax=Sinocyclocheilus grahami TaxID=75366 RepID=A0A672KM62_SINGR
WFSLQASLRGLIILYLLHLCVQSIQGDVNPAALAKMIQYFDDNVQPTSHPDVQYVMVIIVPKAQCTEEQSDIQTVFSREDAENVRNFLNKGEKCVLCTSSKNVIAARPTKKPKEHAEHVLLYPLSNSPMDKLLAETNENSCVVFYSHNSPCVTRCIEGQEKILDGLSNWKNIRKEAMNIFVFNKIWQKDAWRKDMAKDLLTIHEQVPLYRCTRTNVMECQKCVERNNGDVIAFCLPKV